MKSKFQLILSFIMVSHIVLINLWLYAPVAQAQTCAVDLYWAVPNASATNKGSSINVKVGDQYWAYATIQKGGCTMRGSATLNVYYGDKSVSGKAFFEGSEAITVNFDKAGKWTATLKGDGIDRQIVADVTGGSAPTNTQSAAPAASTQSASVPPANNQPLIKYSGPENSIKRFLCTPNISDTSVGTKDETGVLTDTAGQNPSSGDLAVCINRLYRFAGVVGAFAGVFFIGLSGYYYILGGEHGKEKAKHTIVSVIAGLVIIFTPYIFLKQINPEAIKFKPIQPPQLGQQAKLPTCEELGLPAGCSISAQTNPENYVGGNVGGSIANAHPEASCSTNACPTLKGTEVKCTDTGKCLVQPNLLTKLQELDKLMKTANVAWHVGQAYPPSGDHGSACHNTTGSCVDISPDNKTADNFAKMCPLVKQVGLTLLNEAIVTQGNAAAENACGKYTKTEKAEATVANSHLHVGLP